MSKALFLLLLGLCAGGLGGYFLGLDTGERTDASPSARAGPPTEEYLPEERPDTTRAREVRPGDRGSLQEALDAIEVPSWSPGRGTITGVIRTDEGEPVSGVLVRAERIASSRSSGSLHRNDHQEERPLEDRVRELVLKLKREEASGVETLTGDDGRYVLSGISDDRHRMHATRAGYKIVQISVGLRAPRVSAGAVIDFEANAAVKVPVRVYRADGSVPKGASIIAIGRRGEKVLFAIEGWTSKRGFIILRPGSYTLTVGPSGSEISAEWPRVVASFVAGAAADAVIIRAHSVPGIKGNIIIPEGEMASQVRVYHLGFKTQIPDTRALLDGGKEVSVHALSKHQFIFSPLKPGRYLVGATRTPGRIETSATIDVGEGVASLDLTLPAAEARDCVVVHALDPGGDPLDGVSFSVRRSMGGSDFRSYGAVVKQEHGVYWVLHHATAGETDPPPAARWFVSARSAVHGQKEVEYRRGPSSEVTIRFAAMGTLTANLEWGVDRALAGRLQLSLEAPVRGGLGWNSDGLPSGDPDRNGQVELSPLSPGTYRLVVGLKTGRGQTGALSAKLVDVASGPNRVTVRVPKLHTLTLLIPGSKPGAPCTLSGVDPGMELMLREAVGKEGRVTFEMLPAGTYVVSSGQGGATAMEVTVPVPGVVTFKARPVNAVRVWIRDSSGALARAGLRDGDVIVGLDGVDFDGQLSAMTAFMQARQNSEVTLSVQRGASVLQLGVDPRILMSPDVGGILRPARRQ